MTIFIQRLVSVIRINLSKLEKKLRASQNDIFQNPNAQQCTPMGNWLQWREGNADVHCEWPELQFDITK